MNIVATDCESNIRLVVDGRIDTITSPQLQEALLNAFQKKNDVVVDFVSVSYISSAGLRALLIGQKTASSKGGSMRITNVSPSVKEIFEVTGFESILTIE